MTEEQLYNFFYNESEINDRFKMFNFLCAETNKDLTEASFSDEFIEWIGGKSEIANKIGVLDDYYELKKKLKKSTTDEDKQKLNRQFQFKLKSSIESKKTELIDEWISLVQGIHDAYIDYLNGLFKESNEIKYVIISEAPMLTIKEENENILFDCKYIFSQQHENVGSYRKVPFDALQKINGILNHKKGNPSANELINLFIEKRVLFLDLIPLPLPKVDSVLRKNWSTNPKYFINNEPRVITFLRCSLAFIFEFVKNRNHEEICFSETQIALMMPSNSALGIINFYMDLDSKASSSSTVIEKIDPFSGKIGNISKIITRTNNENDAKKLKEYSLRLHRQVAIGSQGGPELELLIHALEN
jgi:hypothetical protein